MKKISYYLLLTILLFACEKLDIKRVVIFKEIPIVSISQNTAIIDIYVLDKGEVEIAEHGFVISNSPSPSLLNSFNTTKLGKPNGSSFSITSTITLPNNGVKYYTRAYITDVKGITTYSKELQF